MSGKSTSSERKIAYEIPNSFLLQTLLNESASRHHRLCPRQVLGVRIGLAGLRILGLQSESDFAPFRNEDKRLLTISETDGCGSDGIAVATGCSVGRRTLRIFDFGKVAATLIDTISNRAVRLAPSQAARNLAVSYASDKDNSWRSYLAGYQLVPDHLLLKVERVELTLDIAEILGKPGLRVICDHCHEEIMNEREVNADGLRLCRSCAGDRYYIVAYIGDD